VNASSFGVCSRFERLVRRPDFVTLPM
jgi:hypothetical protein